jgi:hypothetical protein
VAHIIKTGDNWQRVDVLHRIEGHIMNELIFLSQTEIALKENKRQFRAGFLNQFLSVARCETRYVITAYISLKGIYKMLRPVLEAYVRKQALKQINQYVLEPFKKAAEKVHSEPVRLKGSCQ